ncbi:VIR protein [Plasmodium vivax]|uniref:VIR protein n=1 Tax=Plasmodium vivax TaxID=5855 RepID=A0A1G4E962_PLAVI|nr:VIR protein [Plasmodium vivax]
MYDIVCNQFMTKLDDHKEENKKFCLKLIRNLGRYSLGHPPYFNPNYDRCKILYYWIYNSVRKDKISDAIINECFQDYIEFMKGIHIEPRCSYFSYNDMYEEPMNIIKLDIFQSNINIIQSKLNGEYVSTNFPLRKYICECIMIYKEMKPIYCPKSDAKSEKSNKTCEMLDTFKKTYESYLSSTQKENYKIKSLDKDEVEYLAMCKQDKPRSLLTPEGHGTLSELTSLSGVGAKDTDEMLLYEGAKTNAADRLTHSTDVNVENQGSSMSRTVSTAFGTVAGTTSILALLYKFSPGGNWIRSGIRGSRGRISNNLYADQPNELFYDGF